jgi:nucleoside-diphosphate-sugar epimerase
MNILVIGGTRNLGHGLVHALHALGHRVTTFNRGRTRDTLPPDVERLHGDRTDEQQLANALKGRSFDAVVDTPLFKGAEAEAIVRILKDRTGHYIFLSTGQVYLVREGLERPFREDQYEGRVMPSPKLNTYGYEEWQYGVDKRQAEDRLSAAWEAHRFPYTSLRLPMVNSERDHFKRLYAYILRLNDGGPILAPSTPNYPLRHVYGGDIVNTILRLIKTGSGKGKAYNISQDETLSLDDFLTLLGEIMGVEATVARIKRDVLEANGFLPDCSPFSERWMSELDNTLSKSELGITYTPLRTYLEKIVTYYNENPPPRPAGYKRRRAELLLHAQLVEEPESTK